MEINLTEGVTSSTSTKNLSKAHFSIWRRPCVADYAFPNSTWGVRM